MAFVERLSKAYPNYFDTVNVLEIGSLNINGSVTQFFKNCNYLGVDVGEGPGVDHVMNGADPRVVSNWKGQVSTVISCNCFEHNALWVDTFKNMIEVLKPGGMIIVTAAGTDFPEHGTPRSDPNSSPLTVKLGETFYQNFDNDFFMHHVGDFAIKHLHQFAIDTIPRGDEPGCDFFFFGFKMLMDVRESLLT